MEIALIFGGALLSLVIEFVKTKLNLNSTSIMLLVMVLALVGGVGYKLLLAYNLWESFLGVLIASGAFYTFIIQNIKKSNEPVIDNKEA